MVHLQNTSLYGASYYIDGGDRGTIKFYHGNANNEIVNGSKRSFAVGAGTTDINLSSADDPTDPFITFGSSITNNSYWVVSKVSTSEPLDQSVEVAYVDVANRRYI